jgi:hypothetical protein
MALKIEKSYIVTIALLIAVTITLASGIIGVYAYMREPYIARQITLYSYTKVSGYQIVFYMKPNNIYGDIAVSAESKLPIYLNLVNGINISYIYRVDNAKTTGTLRIVVLLSHPDGWSKKYLDESIEFLEKALANIYIDVNNTIKTMDSLCKEVGLRPSTFNIVINTYIDSKTEIGSITKIDPYNHTITLKVDLTRNRIDVAGNLLLTTPIEGKKTVYEKRYIFGVDVEGMRTASTISIASGAIATATLLVIKMRFSEKENPLKKFESRYRDIIIEVKNIPEKSTLIYVGKPEELVKIARLLETPIHKVVDNNIVKYYVIAEDKTYTF